MICKFIGTDKFIQSVNTTFLLTLSNEKKQLEADKKKASDEIADIEADKSKLVKERSTYAKEAEAAKLPYQMWHYMSYFGHISTLIEPRLFLVEICRRKDGDIISASCLYCLAQLLQQVCILLNSILRSASQFWLR